MPTNLTSSRVGSTRFRAHLAPPSLGGGHGPLLRSARAARRWVGRRRELQMLEKDYAEISRSLDLDPDWRIHRVLSTVGDVTVAQVGGPSPAAVLKCARSARGTAALERSGSVVDSLVSDPRLGDWVDLLPQRLAAAQSPRGHLVVLEEHLPGLDGRETIGSATQERMVDSVLESVSTLHDRTSVWTTIDQELLHRWVDEPISALAAWYHAGGVSHAAALERLRDTLYLGLEGRDARVGWIHGDLAPGNVLLQPETLKVCGVLDWERASAAGLPEVDVVHFQLVTGMLTQDRELGDLVCDVLERADDASSSGISDRTLVLLAWLHHVSGIVAKSRRYGTRGLWGARNVDRVLSRISNLDGQALVPAHPSASDGSLPPRGWVARVGRSRKTWLPSLEMALAVVLWAIALPQVHPRDMSDIGLVSVLPWPFFAGLAVLALSFARTLRGRAVERRLPLVYPLVLAALFYLTPPIVYGNPRYAWAWKHAGIVDFIQRNGSVDPRIDALSVYHNWPGFFAFNAMLTDLAGLRTPLSYVAWAEVFFNVLTVAAVMTLLRCLTRDVRTVAVGGWLFALGNWVGQDYWSPQALNFLWYLVVITMLMRWFPGRPGSEGFVSAADTTVASTPTTPTTPVQRVGLMAVVLLLLVCVVSTHQLTPIALALTTGVLVLFRRTDARALPLLTAVMALAWLLYVAAPFTSSNLAGMVTAIGAVDNNVHGTLIGYGNVSPGLIVVSAMARGLTLAICGLAGLGFLRGLRRGRRPSPSASVLAAAPVALVAFSPYGSEILFRAYLFALPGLVFFGAVLLWPPGTRDTRGRRVVIALVSLVLMSGFVFAQYGNDRRFHFTDAEVDAAEYVYGHAPPNSLLIEGSRNYPSQFENYDNFTYVAMDLEEPSTREEIVRRPTEVLASWMRVARYSAAYIIITRSQLVETESTGGLPGGGLRGIERELRGSPAFRMVFQNRDAVVFVLADRSSHQQLDSPW